MLVHSPLKLHHSLGVNDAEGDHDVTHREEDNKHLGDVIHIRNMRSPANCVNLLLSLLQLHHQSNMLTPANC